MVTLELMFSCKLSQNCHKIYIFVTLFNCDTIRPLFDSKWYQFMRYGWVDPLVHNSSHLGDSRRSKLRATTVMWSVKKVGATDTRRIYKMWESYVRVWWNKTVTKSRFANWATLGVGGHVNWTCHKVRMEIWATVGVGRHVNWTCHKVRTANWATLGVGGHVNWF